VFLLLEDNLSFTKNLEEGTMKLTRSTLMMVALALTIAAAVAVSQTVAHGPHTHGMGMGFDEHMLNFMTDYLDLTDAQQAQVKDILAKEKPSMQPLMEQMRQAHQQLMQLETSNTFDEAKVRALAAQHTQAATELLVQRARVHNEIFQLLTPEQKAKAIKLMNRHMRHMNQTPPAAPSGGGV
jgi:periplasmic protein CpxP/Spy